VIQAPQLLADLTRLLKRIEADLLQRIEDTPELNASLRAEWQAARDAERCAETFETWADQVITQAGVHWLHRLVLAIHFVITLRAGGGVRLVSEVLELSGLSAFVGASYGSQQALNAALEQAVVDIAAEQRQALAAGMPPRQITVCEDETFHPAICLVALEPVSNFILLEQYAEDRTAATWTQALAAACAGLPLTLVQGTSDEAKALRRHIERDHQAHHCRGRPETGLNLPG
jgi:hypothetical protein